MKTPASICISFSGITFRFRFPGVIPPSKELAPLICEDPGIVDEEFEICLIESPLRPCVEPVWNRSGIQIYPTEQGWLRIYTPLIAEDGCQVACLLCPNGKNKLYYPARLWDFFASEYHCLHLLCGETILLKYDAFLLHSSVVMLDGRMVLFSGPSGAGKSTQAALWKKHLGAEIINGDRCLIMRRHDGFWGGGSPWCGTSGIRRREIAPIAGIFLVNQAKVNNVRRLGFDAFAPIFSQTTLNSWDSRFMDKITHLIGDMLNQVPVYRLDCRMDQQAVALAHQALF